MRVWAAIALVEIGEGAAVPRELSDDIGSFIGGYLTKEQKDRAEAALKTLETE